MKRARNRILITLLFLSVAANAYLLVALRAAKTQRPSLATSVSQGSNDGATSVVEASGDVAVSPAHMPRTPAGDKNASTQAREDPTEKGTSKQSLSLETECRRLVASADSGKVGAELEQSVLDYLAREHLREHWEKRRAGIEKWFRSLLQPEEQEKWIHKRVERFTSILDANDQQRDLFAAEYRAMVRPQLETVGSALNVDPVDYTVLTEQTRQLFANEDSLVAKIFGEQAREKFRASQVEARTRLLAIFATYSNEAWESIEW